jgi:hypothetical protein
MKALLDPAVISKEGAEAYRRDGYVKIRKAVSEAEVELLRRAVERQMERLERSPSAYDFQDIAAQVWKGAAIDAGRATRFDMRRFRALIEADANARPLFDEPEMGAPAGRFFYEAAGWRSSPEIRGVALDSRLPEICAALLATNYVNFWEDTTFVKSPGATQRTAFHQDYSYFQISGRKCCIVWIALDAADETNGAMQYVRGSHAWNRRFAPNLLVAQTTLPESPDERLPDIEAAPDHYDIATVCAEPGDVIIHDVFTVHGSGGNRSRDKTRRAISLRYCGDDICYLDKAGALQQPWVSAKPRDGAPLYSRDYPRVWPRPFPGAKLSRLYEDESAAA